MNQTSGVSAELRASIAASIPARCHTTPACPYCDAARDHRCVSATGREVADHRGRTRPHADRKTLTRLLSQTHLPMLGRARSGKYTGIGETGFTMHLTRPVEREVSEREGLDPSRPPLDVSVAVYGVGHGAETGFFLVTQLGRAPFTTMHMCTLRNPAATVERRSACFRAAATAPDVALAQRMLGTLFSDQPPARPVSNLGLTGAQEMFKLRGLPPQFQVNHMTADGRFTFAGVVEPFPGAWPTAAVRPALMEEDYTAL